MEAPVQRRSILALISASALLLAVALTPVAAADMGAGVFRLTLTGAQEATPTCAPPAVCGDPDAIGHAKLVVIPGADKVCFRASWSGIDGTVVAAHIHVAPAGAPGPVVIPLFSGAFDGTDATRDCVSANGLADEIIANPSAYYINVHSTVFPPGAVRDQLG
jgi:CHRD domain